MRNDKHSIYERLPEAGREQGSVPPQILARGLDTLEVGFSANVPQSDIELDTLLGWRDQLRRSSDRDFEPVIGPH